MTINCNQLRTLIVRPTLKYLDLWSEAAEELILGTAAQESQLGTYIHQLGTGPALGIYQCEPATQRDIWENYLAHNPVLSSKIAGLSATVILNSKDNQIVWNLAYATAMCRVHYLRVPKPLPAEDDLQALGEYWKQYYNTPAGSGTAVQFVDNYWKYVKPVM